MKNAQKQTTWDEVVDFVEINCAGLNDLTKLGLKDQDITEIFKVIEDMVFARSK